MDKWKFGLRLKNKEKDVAGRKEIVYLARKLIDLDEDETKELQRRLGHLKEKSRAELIEKGSSTTNHDVFVQCIMYCGRKGRQESETY